MILIVLGLFVSIGLRLNTIWPMERFLLSWRLVIVLVVCGLVFSFFFKLHSIKLRSYESSEIVRYMVWCGLLMMIGTATNAFFQLGAPRTVPIIFGSIVCLLTMGFRFSALQILEVLGRGNTKRTRVAVYGAGAAGLQLISALKRSKEYAPILFLDDSSAMQGLIISGLAVYSPSKLVDLLKDNRVEKVLMAIPSASPNRKRQIIRSIKSLDCEVLELPSYVDMIQSGGIIPSLRPVSPEDLLGRDGVDLELPELASTYAGASVLVSGAGGSIGSELCRKIIKIGARTLVLFEQSEFSLYLIEKELKPFAESANIKLIAVLGSVLDANRIRNVLMDEKVEIVLHAAAYKHVPIVENNVLEGIRNNVIGTNRIAEVAAECGVKRFTLISTDKAVRPTNVMGASKRLAELVVQDCQIRFPDCVFSMVRFGNVLGSSGSVIPLFKEQISNGGPVTLTHPDVTRFFMTIEEASVLVLLAGAYAKGGEVFVLDMGEPVKISQIAYRMIKLSGMSVRDEENPDGDIEIKIIGLRPGEKLYEELLIGSNMLSTPHEKILRANEDSISSEDLKDVLDKIDKAVQSNKQETAIEILQKWVSGYKRQ